MRLRHFILASLAALVAFVSCEDEENLGLPTIKLDGDSTMAFEIAGGDQQITLTATRDWWVEYDADWLEVLPESGVASADAQTITVTAKTNTGMDRTADVKFSIGMSFQTLTVTQAGPDGSVEDLIVYANDFDKELATQTYGTSGDKWPYLDQFDGWKNEKGTGIADVEYVVGGISARNNANSNGSYSDYDGSGNNNLLFGTNNYFAIKNIALGESRNYTVSFGTEKYAGDKDNTFVPSEFHVYISADASKWVELTYTFPGEFKNGRWDLASSTFTLPADVNTLHMYFKSDLASGHRIDDLKLLVSSAAGTAIDFSTGTDMEVGGSGGGNNGGGQEPDATAIYHNTYDKEAATKTYGSGSSWPYLDQFDGWMNAVGTGAENVTYAYKGISARNNSNSNGEHSNYAGSGVNNIFFGKDAYFATRNIALGGTTNLTLTFGTEKYSSENGSVFKNSEYHIWLSNDGGAKWVEFTDYTFAGGTTEGKWNVATANITVPSGTETLSICMAVDVASSYRMDDLKLVAAEAAGTAVDFTDAVEKDFGEGEEVTPPAGGDDPEVPVEPGEYDPQGITWTLGANAYDKTSGQNAQYGKVNDVAVANLLKLGTGSKIGDAILHVPAGTEKIGFYAVAWKGKTAQVKFSINGTELTTIEPSANVGAAENPPYTITVTDDDYFVIEMPSTDAADVKVETLDPNNGRVIFIKLEANPDAEGGETPGEGGEEPEPPVVEETLMTVAEVLASTSALPEGSYIEAVVISDMTLNNLTSKKGLFVQDATGGLQFYLAANHSLNFGDKVKIDLSGQKLTDYNGATQVNGLALEKITTISTDNAVEPKTVTVADFLANKYEGQYIAIEGVQVAESDLAKTFVEGTGDSAKHTSINVETADGKTFVIFSSKYASYGAETVPQGSGTIKGISSISKGTMQLIFAQESDYAGLTGERFGDNAGGEEPEPPVVEESLMTIAEVLASESALPDGSYIEAVVISNMALNNLTSKKGLYVQDATGALQFYLSANHDLSFGDKVKIDLSGVEVGEYNGAVQVSGVALEKITTISTDNAVEPKTVTVADFLANKYEGQYIAIEGVQVAESDLAKTFVEGTGDNAKHTSINVVTADGKTFVIFSSKYASYGAETVPQGSGTIKGISSISKGTMQLIFAQESDYAGLTGERFGDNAGGEEPEPEPEPEVSTVAEVLKSTKGDAVSTKGTVMAIHQRGYILGDATGAIYVYTNSAPTVAVGNNVTLSGTFDNYFGTLQIKNAVVSANDKSTTAPSYPTPVDLTDQAAYDAFKTYGDSSPVDFPYVKIKGVLSGRYITIGTSEKQSMIYYSASDYSDYDGKTVTVTGYIVGFHSSNGYYQIIETSVVADESSEGGNEGGENENPGGEVTPPAGGDEGGNEGGEGENPGGEVTPPAGGASYVRVTETPSDWTGKYLIVYEDAANAYVFNGVDAVNGYVSATISNDAIAASSDLTAYEVSIETMDGGYALKIGEQYIYGTSGSNKLNFRSAQSLNTLTLEEDGVKVVSNTSVLRFNAASNQMRFRYYKAGTYADQKPIQLYKYTE